MPDLKASAPIFQVEEVKRQITALIVVLSSMK